MYHPHDIRENGRTNINPLSANATKWPHTQTICQQQPTKMSIFDHIVGLAFKGLIKSFASQVAGY